MLIRELFAKIGLNWSEADFNSFDARWNRTASNLQSAGIALTAAITAPLAGLAYASVSASAQMEKVRASFDVLTGSVEKGGKFYKDLVDFAAKNPLFDVASIGESAKMMMSMGIPANELIDVMGKMSDIVAGSGVPLERVAYNLGQIRTQNRATAIDLRQFAMAGIPIYEALSNALFGDKTRVKDVMEYASAGKIGYGEVMKAFELLTQKGGMYFGMTEKMADTTSGRFGQLKERIFLFRKELGDTIIETFKLKELIAKVNLILTKFIGYWQNLDTSMKRIILFMGVFAASIGPILIGLGSMIKLFTLLRPLIMKTFLPFFVFATVFALLIDDIMVWTKGGKSFFGVLLGDFPTWWKDVKDFFIMSKDFVKEFFTGDIDVFAEKIKFFFQKIMPQLVIEFANFVESTLKAILPDWLAKLFMSGTGLNQLRYSSELSSTPKAITPSAMVYSTARGAVSDRAGRIAIQAPIDMQITVSDTNLRSTNPGSLKAEVQKAVEDSLNQTANRLFGNTK